MMGDIGRDSWTSVRMTMRGADVWYQYEGLLELPPGYRVSIEVQHPAALEPVLSGLRVEFIGDGMPRSLRVEALRRLPLGAMVRAAVAIGRGDDAEEDVLWGWRDVTRPRGGSREFSEAVAEVYRRAMPRERVRAVAEAFKVSAPQAARYVREARALGVLEESSRSSAG